LLLLDTCALLWLASDQSKLSARARTAIEENKDSLFVSAISAFEIALKVRNSRLELPSQPAEWFNEVLDFHGLHELPVTGAIAALSAGLPLLHNDPCDHIIIASALSYRAPIVTSDKLFAKYKNIKIIW
jgi:PIN domain nuclease of toxin-antitoxin system